MAAWGSVWEGLWMQMLEANIFQLNFSDRQSVRNWSSWKRAKTFASILRCASTGTSCVCTWGIRFTHSISEKCQTSQIFSYTIVKQLGGLCHVCRMLGTFEMLQTLKQGVAFVKGGHVWKCINSFSVSVCDNMQEGLSLLSDMLDTARRCQQDYVGGPTQFDLWCKSKCEYKSQVPLFFMPPPALSGCPAWNFYKTCSSNKGFPFLYQSKIPAGGE